VQWLVVAKPFHEALCFNFLPVTMALVESEVAFQRRCDELELGLFDKFKGQDIISFSTLAFALGSPQNQVNDSELSELAAKIHGGTPPWATRQTSGGFTLKRVLF
jgi:hypothetical protein